MSAKSTEQFESFDVSKEEYASERGAGIPDVTLDPVKNYLKNIGKVTLLNAEQEVGLCKRVEAGLYAQHLLERYEATEGDEDPRYDLEELTEVATDGKAARTSMIEANLRLVVSLAKRYRGRALGFMDLIQEGNGGLIHAVEMFDYAKGFKFSTYATWWIRQSITRALAHQGHTIRVPVHMAEKVSKYDTVHRQLSQNLMRKPTENEIAAELEISLEEVRAIVSTKRQEPISYFMLMGDGGSGRGGRTTEMQDLIVDTHALDPVDVALHHSMHSTLVQELMRFRNSTNKKEAISPRDIEIMMGRFGLDGSKTKTYDELAKQYGLTRAGIRQVLRKTMDKLSHSSRLEEIVAELA